MAVDDLDETFKTSAGRRVPRAVRRGRCQARRRRVTVVATSYMVHTSIKAAKALAHKGIEVEVIDPERWCRSIPAPFCGP